MLLVNPPVGTCSLGLLGRDLWPASPFDLENNRHAFTKAQITFLSVDRLGLFTYSADPI
jgi:hypothetical protein